MPLFLRNTGREVTSSICPLRVVIDGWAGVAGFEPATYGFGDRRSAS